MKNVVAAAVAVMAAVAVTASETRAQMFAPLFDRPARPADVAAYPRFAQCAAILTKWDNKEFRDELPKQKDTLPPSAFRAVDTLSTVVVTDVRRCAAKFTVASVFPNNQFRFGEAMGMVQLLLVAGRDAEADALVRQWIATIPPSTDRDSVVATIAFEVSQIALRARPRRFALAEAMAEIITDWKTYYSTKVAIMGGAWQSARIVGADSVARRLAAWHLRLPVVLRDSVFKGDSSFVGTRAYQTLARNVYRMTMRDRRAIVLDSISVSDQAYQRLIDATLRLVSAKPGWDPLFDRQTFNWSTASKADTIKDVFQTYPAGVGARPTLGKPAVVVRLGSSRACQENCPAVAAFLRRLRQRFPDVEINLVEAHWGHVLTREPPGLQKEAVLMDSVLHEKYRMPGTLLVFKNPFVQLPEPDGRWIKIASPNDGPGGYSNPGYYVISDEGRLIFFGDLPGANPYMGQESAEQAIMETIQVLMVRMTTRRNGR